MRVPQLVVPRVPDRTAETIALVVAASFLAILGYVASQDFRLGRSFSDFLPIAAVGLSQVAIATVAWFILRRKRHKAEVAKQRFYESLRNG